MSLFKCFTSKALLYKVVIFKLYELETYKGFFMNMGNILFILTSCVDYWSIISFKCHNDPDSQNPFNLDEKSILFTFCHRTIRFIH